MASNPRQFGPYGQLMAQFLREDPDFANFGYRPVHDANEVRQAIRDMFGQGLIVDTHDPDEGLYLVQLPDQAIEVLNNQGYLDVTNVSYRLLVE